MVPTARRGRDLGPRFNLGVTVSNEEQDVPPVETAPSETAGRKTPAPTKEDMKKVVSGTEEKGLNPEGVKKFETRDI